MGMSVQWDLEVRRAMKSHQGAQVEARQTLQ